MTSDTQLFDTYESLQHIEDTPTMPDPIPLNNQHDRKQNIKHLNKMTKEQLKLFRYTKLCEVFSNNDEELQTWTPISIDKFILRKRDPEDIHIRIRVIWLNGERNWVRLDDFQMEHPDMVTNFSLEHNLYNYKPFHWTKAYDEIRQLEKRGSIFSNSPEARAILATRYEAKGKFQFGVEVPYNVKHALRLDLQNGNDL